MRVTPVAFALWLALGVAPAARAGTPVRFGPHDVQTTFAIGKSDDGNQVQYGLRLDEDCRPVGEEPVVGYWRMYDDGPDAPLLPLSWLDRTAYGIDRQVLSPQGPAGPTVVMAIRTAPRREIELWVSQAPDGTCLASARTRINGRTALLKLIYIKLSGPFVSWVEIRGVAVAGAEALAERVRL
jgi:hypothetical protein